MSDQLTLEQRLSALEREVSILKRRLDDRQPQGSWVEGRSGSMKNFPEFLEVVRLGREARQAIVDNLTDD